MSKLAEVVGYICSHYPHRQELSNARVTKMVYLADWKSAIDRGKQITDIQWLFHHYGPYVDDVSRIAREDDRLNLLNSVNLYGGDKVVIEAKERFDGTGLRADERKIIDHVITHTQSKTWDDFIKLVYSTRPITTTPRYSNLDLVALAEDYRTEISDASA